MYLSGVIHLHCEHVIHRDLATRNCLVKLSPTSIALDLNIPSLSRFIYSLVPWPLLSWPTRVLPTTKQVDANYHVVVTDFGLSRVKTSAYFMTNNSYGAYHMHAPSSLSLSLSTISMNSLAMANASVFFCFALPHTRPCIMDGAR